MFELGKIKSLLEPAKPLWFQEWLSCIIENATNGEYAQNICSVHTKDFVPNVAYLATAECLLASLGICVFIVFGTSVNLWSEWRFYITKKFGGVSETLSNDVPI